MDIHTENNKLATSFHQQMSRLRRIVNGHWPDKISNNDLWTKTDQKPALIQINRSKWSCLRHTVRRNDDSIAKQALQWQPQGHRRTGRPRKKLGEEIWSQKWEQQDSSTSIAGVRWRRRLKTELDGGKQLLDCGPCATRSDIT